MSDASYSAVRDGYGLWAHTYDTETPVSRLDEEAAQRLSPGLADRRLLDVGCGTGRRLPRSTLGRPTRVVGVDLVRAMLRQAKRRVPDGVALAAADVRALPFGTAAFDVVWCRLVIGHVRELAIAYRELARVAARGAPIIVTDFHPRAAAHGYARSFRTTDGRRHTLEHHRHELSDHTGAAARAGLTLDAHLDLVIRPTERAFYEAAGMLTEYERHVGSPFVLALRFIAH